jgi:CheY-like chemotaxis protein
MNKPEVLIIDDEPSLRSLLEMTLLRNGFAVASAASAKAGLIQAANHPPAAILLDLGLPDRPGQELLRELRQWYTAPVIILSVQRSEEEIIQALDNGANDYLTKPFARANCWPVSGPRSGRRSAMKPAASLATGIWKLICNPGWFANRARWSGSRLPNTSF